MTLVQSCWKSRGRSSSWPAFKHFLAKCHTSILDGFINKQLLPFTILQLSLIGTTCVCVSQAAKTPLHPLVKSQNPGRGRHFQRPSMGHELLVNGCSIGSIRFSHPLTNYIHGSMAFQYLWIFIHIYIYIHMYIWKPTQLSTFSRGSAGFSHPLSHWSIDLRGRGLLRAAVVAESHQKGTLSWDPWDARRNKKEDPLSCW